MNKPELKEKVIKNGKEVYLSAQAYNALTDDEKGLLKEVLKDEKKDDKEYDRRMRKLWPKEFHPKPLTWRKKYG